MSAKKQYVLYDARANYSVDDAAVLCTADSLREARDDKRSMFPDAVIYEYDVRRGNELVNGRRV